VGVDVARALEYASPSKAVIDHCKGITKLGIPSNGGVQETNVITEGDIIRLITKAADQSKNENIRAVVAQMEERG
jgi:prophage antirepressor-like protein